MTKKIHIVAATTKTQAGFKSDTLLGDSLKLVPSQDGMIELSVLHENSNPVKMGLSQLYNLFLTEKYRDCILLFVHDDVEIRDWHLALRLNEAIKHFDVVGIAGNTKPDYRQPSWVIQFDDTMTPTGWQDKANLSGAVAHHLPQGLHLDVFGPTPAETPLLDGLFIAVNTEKILDKDVRFDERFGFHFYDLDFCRQCTAKGLKIGTWPISISHGSMGNFSSAQWAELSSVYLEKWGHD